MLLASRFVDVQDAEGPFRVQDELWYQPIAYCWQDAEGPFRVQDELWYQPIAYCWAQNLGPYDTKETNRFVKYYDSMSAVSGMVLATEATTTE